MGSPTPFSMLHLYNTLSRQEEPFAPLNGTTVRLYGCGPTVYARAHIGNFRTYVCLDVLRRTLKYLCGYDVRQVVNYTDIDDKTIAAALAAGVPLREYTDNGSRCFGRTRTSSASKRRKRCRAPQTRATCRRWAS